MEEKLNIQVPKETYYEDYDTVLRFISYHYQIEEVLKAQPDKCLEIGVGNKTVANYIKQCGINIDTCDFDPDLEPDFVADIRKLPLEDKTYDMTLACEIIEHIPWEDVPTALKELQRVKLRQLLLN